nr:MAG TPA: hypothetical protein [Caudoviricetes sp.]
MCIRSSEGRGRQYSTDYLGDNGTGGGHRRKNSPRENKRR